MTRRRTAPPARKTSRRWHIPPPLLHGPEALEGGNVLQEVQGETGVLLWQTLRDVMLWAQTPPAERGEIFSPGAHERRLAAQLAARLDPAIDGPMHTLAGVLADPLGTNPESIALACRHVVQWAEARGALSTALAFAQDAALACPADPAAAFTVGRIARIAADYARAEVWFRRAFGLARQARDWRMYSHSFRGLGHLYWQRGSFPAARRFYIRALRGARRGGMRHEQGQALHDLFALHVDMGRVEEAERFAREAFEAYGPRSARLPNLAHDVAYWWMSQGYFARALKVFQVILPHFSQPLDRLFALADIARAAGGSGDAELFDRTWEEVRAALDDAKLAEGEARVQMELAHGASSLGRWSHAAEAATRALAVAEQRSEGKIRITAEALLGSIQRRQVMVRPAAPEAPSAPLEESGEKLADDFVATLKTYAAAAV